MPARLKSAPFPIVQSACLLQHCCDSLAAERGSETNEQAVLLAVRHRPRSKGVSEEIELPVRILPSAAAVFAADDFGFFRMHRVRALRDQGNRTFMS